MRTAAGSTNLLIHLVHGAAGGIVGWTAGFLQIWLCHGPLLARVYPNGLADVEPLSRAGLGLYDRAADVGGLLHDEVTKRSRARELSRYKPRSQASKRRCLSNGVAGPEQERSTKRSCRPIGDPFQPSGRVETVGGKSGQCGHQGLS